MSDKNLTTGSLFSISHRDGCCYKEYPQTEVEEHGHRFIARSVDELEAKALLSREYGFELNSIQI